jgi:hypothetical protein
MATRNTEIPRTPPIKKERVKLPAKFHKKTPKSYKPYGTTKKPFDDQLIGMVDQQKFVMQNFLEALKPECPECHKSNVKEKGERQSYCVGTKTVYYCMNEDCPRKTFTIDDDRFRNMALKAVTYEALYFSKGDKDVAKLSRAMLTNYAVAPDNMPIMAHLKELTSN